jgi:PAS domain S-box-containing protein
MFGAARWLPATPTAAALLAAGAAAATWVLASKIVAWARLSGFQSARVALQETNGQLLLTEQLSGVGHWRLSLPARKLTWSAEIFRIYGLEPAKKVPPLGQVLAAYHPDDREKVRLALEMAITEGRPYRSQSRVVRPDGSIRHIESRGIPQHGPDGTLLALFGVSMDITERHSAEKVRADFTALSIRAQASEEANRAKSAFLTTMSHELRTPLNAILGNAELLRLEGGLAPPQAARVDMMLGAGSHLLQIINQVLELSEIEQGHLQLNGAETDPRELARACLDLVRPMAQAKGLRLGLSVAPDVPHRVAADPARLRQVLVNLLGNAVKFTGTGSIELRVRPRARVAGLEFEVADTGPGITGGQRDRLFHAFDRLDASGPAAPEGNGVGLSIAYRLVTLMQGRIDYEDNPGGGSLFRVQLPLQAVKPAGATPAGSGAARIAAPLAPLDVLVVDDVDMNREIARAFLAEAGHRAVCAASGAEAIEAVRSNDFDAVLMDVRMPGMDGLEATRLIRQIPGPRGQVPVVALTAQAFGEQIEACRTSGMTGHIVKPYTQQALVDALTQSVAPRNDTVEKR